MVNDELFEDLDDLQDEYGEASTDSLVQQSSPLSGLAKEHNLGGFEGMDQTAIQNFQNSAEYNSYKADVSDNLVTANSQGKTVQEIFGLSSLKESVHQSFHAFEHYDVDLEFYQDIYDTSPIMQQTVQEGIQIYPAFDYLHQDIFLSLMKYRPRLLPESDIHLSTKLNHKFAQLYLNTPEYIKLRQTCRMDQFNAAIGTEILGKKLLEIITTLMLQHQEAMEKMNELMNQEQKMDELLEENEAMDELLQDLIANGQGNGTQAMQLQQQMDANKLAMQQFKQLANTIYNEMDELIDEDDLANEIQRQVGKTFDNASMEVAETSDLVNAWGFGEGEKCRVAYQNKKEAIERIRRSDKLKKLTDMIGRFKESAITEQKKKVKNGATEIHSVTTGNDIQSLLPSELALLTKEQTKPEFYSKFNEKRTLQYSKESNKSKNKGPIIICVDCSGSMSGDEEMWSKAMAMGVLEVAQMQKRDYGCILYSSTADDPIIIGKDEISPEKTITICESFEGGGTNFERPLQKALDMIKNSKTWKEADIMFITDGDCSTSDTFLRKFNAAKEEYEFKTKGILIDLGRYSSSDASLREFCDDVVRISSIADLKDGDSDVNKQLFAGL
jgi:uncharacterized protein with von Willebrand factor type A (vWA) domain